MAAKTNNNVVTLDDLPTYGIRRGNAGRGVGLEFPERSLERDSWVIAQR